MDRQMYDVVIVGGGMAGATLALQLCQSAPSLSIAVIDACSPSTAQSAQWSGYDDRSTALGACAQETYCELEVWDSLIAQAAPIKQVHVSDRGRFGVTRFHAEDHQRPALGYVVSNRRLGQILTDRLVQSQQIEWLCPMEVCAIEPCEQQCTVQIKPTGDNPKKKPTSVAATLTIVCDGGRSPLLSSLGFDSVQVEYNQHAVIANVTPSKPHRGCAYERFTATGPMALLPLPKGDMALVWTMPTELASERMELIEQDFLKELQETFGYRMGEFVKVGSATAIRSLCICYASRCDTAWR